MLKLAALALIASLFACAAFAGVTPYPASFETKMVAANGTTLFVRTGGTAPE